MRRIPKNYVPCVFLGHRDPMKGTKCPATGWDSSALLEEESSRSSIELNNNSCIDKDCQQWADVCTTKPPKEVCAKIDFQWSDKNLKNKIAMFICLLNLKYLFFGIIIKNFTVLSYGLVVSAGPVPPDALHPDAAVWALSQGLDLWQEQQAQRRTELNM